MASRHCDSLAKRKTLDPRAVSSPADAATALSVPRPPRFGFANEIAVRARGGGAKRTRVEPLDVWFDEAPGDDLPLPRDLAALYGALRMPARRGRPHVFANFVSSVDGVVVVDPPRGSGGDISGRDAHDRAVMALLRACADAVLIGAGTLRAEPRHLWTAEKLAGELAPACRELRAALGKAPQPLQLVVTGSGAVDLGWRVFGGEAPVLVATTAAGAARLRAHGRSVPIADASGGGPGVTARGALAAAGLGAGALVLCECGPTLLAQFLAAGEVDELFLTVAPSVVGRSPEATVYGLAEGRLLGTGHMGRLLSARRRGSFLFLRYAMPSSS
jgi:riboflavin biosynthesis pyrimidine reductase